MPTRKAKPARKRTGWSVASAAGKVLAELKKPGRRIELVAYGAGTINAVKDITNRIERICASALGQAESSGRRKRK